MNQTEPAVSRFPWKVFFSPWRSRGANGINEFLSMFRVDCGLKVDEAKNPTGFFGGTRSTKKTPWPKQTWHGNCKLGNLKSFGKHLHKKNCRPPLEAVCFGGFGVFIWRSRKEDLHHRHRQEQRRGLSGIRWFFQRKQWCWMDLGD